MRRYLKFKRKLSGIFQKAITMPILVPLFKNLQILPYDKIFVQFKLHFIHAIEYGFAPKTFGDIWEKNKIGIMDICLETMLNMHSHILALNYYSKS
jgi:hypothetical protein